MPVAVPFEKYEANRSTEQIVEDFVLLATTLEMLHSKSIHHRDIKPANLLYWNGRLCFSDFGLVKYPEREEITPKKRDVGPKFTMAPEMRRYAAAADGGPADVYSFCKTLWIAITRQNQGFDGQYTTNSIVSLKSFVPTLYTTTLDQLFVECTDNDPRRRPDIKQVTPRLKEWLKVVGDFHARNQSEWAELQHTLFPCGTPTRVTWEQIDATCAVLEEIAKVPALNHMFYPSGGGNTITAVSRASEHGLIALHVGECSAVLLRPKKLTYESFGIDPNWNYFRLEAAPLEPTGIRGAVDSDGIYEALTEISPGKYIPYHHWANNDYQGQLLPSEARPINRFLKGSFVFFGTRSTYNQDPRAYDARHDEMTEDEFRQYIQANAIRLSATDA
jgi:serine/threonine-protein kinase